MNRLFHPFDRVRFMTIEDVDLFVKSGWKDWSLAVGDLHPDYDKCQYEFWLVEYPSTRIPATP